MDKRRILVVEDERIVSLDIQHSLNRLGYIVAGTATHGEEALHIAGTTDPDLVLMDITLEGDMDGIETAVAMNRQFELPVIYLTAATDTETLERAKRSGSFGYMLKPFEERELFFTIEMALYKNGMERHLRRATLDAETASEAKTAFLATVSHELRTPMNGILGMTELLLQTPVDDEQREYLNLVKDSGMALLGVLNDILDYSRIEARTLELRTGQFNLKSLLTETLVPLKKQADNRGIELNCTLMPDTPRNWRGDSGRLKQVLANLVHNALSYTETGGIEVDVSLADKDIIGPVSEHSTRKWLHVSVADTGIGISDDQMSRIFDSFTQVEDYMTRRRGGLGLGLAISSKLVDMLGGDIRVSGEPGKGATFEFTAGFTPLDKKSPTDRAPHHPEKFLEGLRVLIVEDDPISLKFVQTLLAHKGCETKGAVNGQIAVDKLKSNAFDVVIMDIQMPVMNGLNAARAIRNPKTGCLDSGIPIVALTAHAGRVDRTACRDAGMDGYLAKPVDAPVLIEALRTAVQAEVCELPERRTVSLDLEGMLRRLGGDKSLLKDVLLTFYNDIPAQYMELASAVEAEDGPMTARLAHLIGGAAMNAGAADLHHAAERVSKLARGGDLFGAAQLLPGLDTIFEETLDCVKKMLDNGTRMKS